MLILNIEFFFLLVQLVVFIALNFSPLFTFYLCTVRIIRKASISQQYGMNDYHTQPNKNGCSSPILKSYSMLDIPSAEHPSLMPASPSFTFITLANVQFTIQIGLELPFLSYCIQYSFQVNVIH